MTTPATAEDLHELLGDVDDLAIERILETRASTDEVAGALADLEDELQSGERREATSARIAEVRVILEDLLIEENDDDALRMPGQLHPSA